MKDTIEKDAETVRVRINNHYSSCAGMGYDELCSCNYLEDVAAFDRILAEVDELHSIAEQATQRGMDYLSELTLEKKAGEALERELEEEREAFHSAMNQVAIQKQRVVAEKRQGKAYRTALHGFAEHWHPDPCDGICADAMKEAAREALGISQGDSK